MLLCLICMVLSPLLWISFCTAAALSASVLQPSQLGDGLSTKPIASPELLLHFNASVPSGNVSSPSGNVLKIACDSSRYGKNLKVKSCRQLFGYMKRDNTQYAFAQRDTGIPQDFPLPMRTYSADGLCFVQPILVKGAVVGHASTSEIGQGAYTMLQTCVVERGMGGLAFNLGGDNKMNVVISDFKPNVKCSASAINPPEWEACVMIFTVMKATKKFQIFGSSEDEAVEEELPLVLEAADGNCQVAIDIVGKDTLASWYELWESVTAIASMCTRAKSRGGKAKGLGLHKNIFLELSGKKPYPSIQAAKWQNMSSVYRSTDLQKFQGSSAGADYSEIQEGLPFELVASHPDDDSSLVSLVGETSANLSQLAIV